MSSQSARMRIGQLAARLGVNPRTIRYYEQIGLLPPAERTHAGYRLYSDVDEARLTFIRSAQRLGMSLDEVAEVLRLRDQGQAPCAYVLSVVDAQIDGADRRIAELQQLRRELTELRAAAAELPENPGGTCRIVEHSAAAAAR